MLLNIQNEIGVENTMLNYFDIETTGFNAEEDKIISIQYQEINDLGEPSGKLVILKEWESCEEDIVKIIHSKLVNENVWGTIPTGTNLIFDLTFLWASSKSTTLKLLRCLIGCLSTL